MSNGNQAQTPSNNQCSVACLRLTTSTEVIERNLYDRTRETVKFGRQVKTAQEKLQGQTPPEGNEGFETVSGQAGVTLSTALSSQIAQTAITNTSEPVWFKSKVVSRSHAEIWFKDGQACFSRF